MAVFTVREADAIYLAAYLAKTIGEKGPDDDVRYRAWQSTICQECGNVPTAADDAPHILDADGFVLICCEGYHQVNPNVLGLESPNWSDWHEEVGGLEPPATNPCRHCGQSVGECRMRKGLEMPNCCGLCNHEEE